MNICFIPDVQAKPGHCFKYLNRIGRYIARQQPEVIVQIGDFADMPAFSSYEEKGSKKTVGQTYQADFDAAYKAMDALMGPIARKAGYSPKMHLTLGNHEDRITRALNLEPKLEGTFSLAKLRYREYGWKVHPFLSPLTIGGVVFQHYFPSGAMGKPHASASTMLTGKNALHMSAMAGHKQGKETVTGRRGDGTRITCTIAGSCYEHDEDYMPYLSNRHWRGVIFMHAVKNGEFDGMDISLDWLKEKFG